MPPAWYVASPTFSGPFTRIKSETAQQQPSQGTAQKQNCIFVVPTQPKR